MPYVVLGLGMLVSAIGAYAMYSGFRIIEIERGWATAIVGSVLFAGGLVTMAIGLAVKTLETLKAALGSRPGVVAESREVATQSAAPAQAIPEAPDMPTQAAPLPAAGSSLVATPADVLEEEAASAMPTKPRRIFAESLPRDEQEPVPTETDDEFFVGAARHRDPKPADSDPFPFAEAPPVFVASGLDEEGAARQQPDVVTPVAAPAGAPMEPSTDPAMDSWLNESFADLDENEKSAHDAAAQTDQGANRIDAARSNVDLAPDTAADIYADVATTIDESTLADTSSSVVPAQEAASTPAVIGRYESEGTSYVMYADGSIEAQSDAGVYRFASMAELKAFIES